MASQETCQRIQQQLPSSGKTLGKFFTICATIFWLASALLAQTPYRIEGAVYDFATLEPIAGAEISCGAKFVTADESGHFVIDCAREGENSLTAEHIAYTSQQVTLKTSGTNAPVNIFLHPNARTDVIIVACIRVRKIG